MPTSEDTASSLADRERERSAVLHSYRILDTPREDLFDDLARIASEVCGTPIAVVNLVDTHRQFFKAEVGLGVRETPLDTSFCGHAILAEDFMMVEDATKDPRFDCNPLVTADAGLRFYAGALLKTPEGLAVGTVCVLDVRPRRLDEHQILTLKLLARQAMAQLELRKGLEEREEVARRLAVAERRARHEGSKLKNMFEQAPGFMALLEGPGHRIAFANRAYRALVGNREIIGRPVLEALPDAAAQGYVALLDQVYESGEAYSSDGSLYSVQIEAGGPIDERYLDFIYQPILDEDGKVTGVFVQGSDVTETVRQGQRREAIRDLGERLQTLSDIGDIAQSAAEIMAKALGAQRAGFGIVDPITETVEMQPNWCAPGVSAVVGQHRFRDYGSFIDDLKRGEMVLVPDVEADPRTAESSAALLGLGIRGLLNVPVEQQGAFVLVVFVHHNRVREWPEEDLAFVRQVGDRTQAAFARSKAEEQQQMLNQELSHRLKNSLAMVQAVAGQTLRGVTEQDAVEAFRKRVHALSVAHEVLVGQNWSSASMEEVIAAAIATFGQTERFIVNGPAIKIGARAALSLSLLVHELSTNAMKYGALSAEAGRVGITWSVEKAGGDDIVVLSWRELGGPAVEAPSKPGFGSRLIKMGLIGTGGVELRYQPSGFEAELKAPLAQMQTS